MATKNTLAPDADETFPHDEFTAYECDATEVANFSGMVDGIYAEEEHLLIVRNVFDPELLGRVAKKLENEGQDLMVVPTVTKTEDRSERFNIGRAITPTMNTPEGPSLDLYLEDARKFAVQLADLFEGVDPVAKFQEVLSPLAAGRPVATPTEADGRHYNPLTIRAVPPGKEINLHVGKFFFQLASYTPIVKKIDAEAQISFFVPIQVPDQGGRLTVYFHKYGDPRGASFDVWTRANEDAITGTSPAARFAPRVGDMLIFDGGRYYHTVDMVGGAKTRWTIGGFLALDRAQEKLLMWS